MIRNTRQLLEIRRKLTAWFAFKNRGLKMAREYGLDEDVVATFCDAHICALEAAEMEYLGAKDALDTSKLRNLIDSSHVLLQARIASGLSQAELARQLELSPQQIHRYEKTGFRSVSLSTMIKIAELLEDRLKGLSTL